MTDSISSADSYTDELSSSLSNNLSGDLSDGMSDDSGVRLFPLDDIDTRRRLENRLAERQLEKDLREFDFDI